MWHLSGLLQRIVLLMVASSAWLPAAVASPPLAQSIPAGAPMVSAQNAVRLLSSSAAGLTFEVVVPNERLRLASVTVEGREYTEVLLSGWPAMSRPGAPALPYLAEVIGVPFGAVLDVRVTPSAAHIVTLHAPVLPAARQKVELGRLRTAGAIPARPEPVLVIEEDPAVYGRGGAFPSILGEVTNEGIARQQRVAGVAVHPVQYDPASQVLTVYERLMVEVRFAPGPAGSAAAAGSVARAEPQVYEEAFQQSLLNYEAARAWRQQVLPSLSVAPATEAGAGVVQDEATVKAEPWAPPEPGWRVKVGEAGMYRLTYAELLAAGVPVNASLPTSTFQLFYLGGEVALEVSDVDGDEVMDPEDSLLFYGQRVDSKYTADNVYWLTYGHATGRRMALRAGTPDDTAAEEYYPARRWMEPNVYYQQSAPGDDHLERWFADYIFAPYRPAWNHTFSLTAPYDGEYSGQLTVVLLGYLEDSIDPDHHVTISLNGTQVADTWWDGAIWHTVEVPVAQGLLVDGENTLSVVAVNDTGVGYDYLFIDRAELEFANTFVAEANELSFSYDASGTWKFQVDGFTTDDLAVYDVTDPAAPARIENIGVAGSGPYSVVFQDTLAVPVDYWAMASSAYRSVQAIEQDNPSNLRSTANVAEHLIIAHRDFAAQAEQLRAFRASQGWSALNVDVQDVYDEFGYGLVGAAPIHDFLAYAYGQWAGAPSVVVLIGDGHYDPKDYAGFGRVSFIPPYLAAADPWSVETAADNRYVTLVGDDTFPDMMLGRLAVNTAAEAQAFVDKIVAYEQDPVPGDWQQRVLAVADNADDAGDYAAASDSLLACCLPAPYQQQRVYYGLDPYLTVDAARAAILSGINAGALIVNYIGHGAYSVWAHEALFRNTDVAGLTNGGKLPIILPMTCMDGYYIYPHLDSSYNALGEVVTRAAGKGAVASWSPTGMGVATGHEYLDRGFFQAVFEDGLRSLGQATTASLFDLWATGSDLDLLDTYLLFGDPATGIPALDVDLELAKAVEPVGVVQPGDVLTYTLTFTNAGPSIAHNVVLSDVLPAVLADAEVLYESPEVVGQVPGQSYVWEIADLAPGAGGEIQLKATVNLAAEAGTIVNVVEVRAAEPEIAPEDNTASVSSPVLLPDLWMDKTVRPGGQVAPGTVLTYTVTFGNAGLEIAHGVVLTDIIPSLLLDPEVLTVTAEVLDAIPGVTLAWQIVDLAPGDEGEISFRARVDPTAELVEISNEAEIAGSGSDGNLGNNTASTLTPVGSPPTTLWTIYLPLVTRQVP